MKNILLKKLILIIPLILLSCNKNDDDDDGPNAYFPKQITIETTLGLQTNSKVLTLTYNSNNLITTIDFTYTSGVASANSFQKIIFEYTDNQDIKTIATTSVNNEQTTSTFNHDEFGVITLINHQNDEGTFDVTTSYDPQSNEYSLEGDLAIFPLEINFDNNDVFNSISGPTIIDRSIDFDNQENGLFKHFRQQPELILFAEIFTFGSLNVNLNYLYPYKINTINAESLNHRIFENHEYDIDGKLIGFSSHILNSSTETAYNIQYELRNL